MHTRLFLIAFLLLTAGCQTWRTAPFDISVKNSSADEYEVDFNGETEKKVLGPVDTRVYRVYSKAEGTDPDYYGYGPNQPERTEIRFTARNMRTGQYSITISFDMRQDETAFVEISSDGIPVRR